MSDTNIFEYATRNKLRFASVRGDLDVERLWDAPLRPGRVDDGFNLDAIAKNINKELKEASEESFVVKTSKTAAQKTLEVKLAIAKHIIDTKLTEEEAKKKAAANKQEKEELLAILAAKQKDKLSGMDEEEIKKRIAALGE